MPRCGQNARGSHLTFKKWYSQVILVKMAAWGGGIPENWVGQGFVVSEVPRITCALVCPSVNGPLS